MKHPRIGGGNLYFSHSASRSGEVIESSFSIASGKLINLIFGTESCTLRR